MIFRFIIISVFAFNFAWGQDTFVLKLKTFEKYNSDHIKFSFYDIDTLYKVLSFKFEFNLNDKAKSILSQKFNPTEKPTSKTPLITFQFDSLTINDNFHLIIADSPKVNSVNHLLIETNARTIVGFEPSNGCPTLYLYFEFDVDDWYFFKYNCGLLSTISTNELYNSVVSPTKIKAKRKYFYGLTHQKYRDDFLRKVQQITEVK